MIRASVLGKYGFELTQDDAVCNHKETGVVSVYEFGPRRNAGAQPVRDGVTVIATSSSGEEYQVPAEDLDWELSESKHSIESWKPSMEWLLMHIDHGLLGAIDNPEDARDPIKPVFTKEMADSGDPVAGMEFMYSLPQASVNVWARAVGIDSQGRLVAEFKTGCYGTFVHGTTFKPMPTAKDSAVDEIKLVINKWLKDDGDSISKLADAFYNRYNSALHRK